MMARGKKIDEARLIAFWALDGVSVALIAQMVGTTPGATRAAAKRLNLPKRERPRTVCLPRICNATVGDAALLASLWQARVRVVDIATEMGCSQGHVTRLVKRAGLPRRRGEYAARGQRA